MIELIALGAFIIVWIWVAFEISNAPLFDENEMPIDIKKEDVEDNLFEKEE